MALIIARPPENRDELWMYVKAMWGFEIPRHNVCPDHSAPFDAFAEAFFGEAPISLWKASRGFGGKSTLMGVLSLTEAVALGAQVTVLGGSASQSQRVHEVTHEMWYSDRAPKNLLKDDPTQFKTKLKGGAWITALMASQKSVRGPHPQRLRLDEVDEMEMEIFEAAQGQPMDARGLLAQTVISSTHQYPNGCHKQGTLILTHRGEVPIEKVKEGDYVPTRSGWRQVLDTVFNGYQTVGTIELSNGRTLSSTLDHPIAVGDRWVEFGDLTVGQEVDGISPDLVVGQIKVGPWDHASPGPPTPGLLSGSDPLAGLAQTAARLVGAGVGPGVFVPVGAVGLADVGGSGPDSSDDVLPLGDSLQMGGVDAGSVTAEVVEFKPLRDRANEADVSPPVRSAVEVLPVNPPVALSLGSLPLPALPDYLGSAQEPVSVISVHAGTVVPTYDIHVDGQHEYVAEGVVVHNTMTKLLKRANQKGWPVHHWCWRESVGTEEHPGWLSMEAITRKKHEVSETMWNTEYDLQEPSHAGRAINTEAVEFMFDPELGVYEGDLDERLIFELPVDEGTYVTGVDWAKELDWTIMSTWRTDVNPWRRVAFLRTGRKPWPQMVGDLQTRLDMFGGLLVHDATGLGDVLDDLIIYDRNKTTDFVLRGRQREAAFNEFVSGVEQRAMTGPRVKFAFEELKYATANDLYGSGHPPDSFVADALAWSRRNAYIPLVSPAAILKS